MSDEHPSFLELDRVALGERADEVTGAHLASCAQCQGHVERAQSCGVAPAWVRGLDDRQRDRGPRWLWAGGIASLAVATAVVLLVVRTPNAAWPGTSTDFTTVKGSASVAVHVKRDGRVWLWDGESPLLPWDGLRLEVVPDGYLHVAVFTQRTVDGADEYTELYAAPLTDSTTPTVLPRAWQVDDAPGPEILVVVMSRAPVTAADLQRGSESLVREGAWVERLTFPKQSRGTDL